MLAIIIGSMVYKSIPAFNNYTLNLEIDMTVINLSAIILMILIIEVLLGIHFFHFFQKFKIVPKKENYQN